MPFLSKLVTALLLAAAPKPAPTQKSVRQIVFVVDRPRDGHQYPNDVKETYELFAGRLRYSAYFGGMPIDMNHTDSVEWNPEGQESKLFALVLSLADDPTSGLALRPDDAPSPSGGPGIYLVGIEQNHADVTHSVEDQQSKAWKALDPAFRALVARFQKATHRPLKPGELPQARVQNEQALTREAALALAVPAANTALDGAYAQFSKDPAHVAPKRERPWVTAADAVVSGEPAKGFVFSFERHAPSGFEFSATVKVSPKGEVALSRVSALFSPD